MNFYKNPNLIHKTILNNGFSIHIKIINIFIAITDKKRYPAPFPNSVCPLIWLPNLFICECFVPLLYIMLYVRRKFLS